MGWDALAAWGEDTTRIARLTGGSSNDVWSVRLNGRPAVARLGRRSDDDLAWEARLLQHLERHGLVVPAPIPTPDGRFSVDGLTVMPFIEGHAASTADDWRGVAATLREVHRLTAGWPQRPGWRSSTDLLRVTQGTRIDLRAMPAEAVTRCRAAWARCADRPTAVVHGNPTNPQNIRVTQGGIALIDWDEAHVDVPELDLALPHNAAGLDPATLDIASQASAAWEAAICWRDDYAVARLAEVRPVD